MYTFKILEESKVWKNLNGEVLCKKETSDICGAKPKEIEIWENNMYVSNDNEC